MKKITTFIVICLLSLLFVFGAFAAGLGPVMKASDAAKMPDDARVVVKGKIKATAELDRFVLEDSSGEIMFNVKAKRLNGVELKIGDVVEVAGEMDADSKYGAKIEAYAVIKDGAAVKYTTVAQASKAADDTWVVVKGKLKLKIDDEEYTFADASGEMIVEIDDDNWGGVKYDQGKEVELRGEIDVNSKGITKLDVDFIREL